MKVGGVVGDQSWIGQGSWYLTVPSYESFLRITCTEEMTLIQSSPIITCIPSSNHISPQQSHAWGSRASRRFVLISLLTASILLLILANICG